jgi:hypothetical protein
MEEQKQVFRVSNKVDGQINWEHIHGRFMMLTEEEYGNGSFAHLSKVLGVPKSTFHLKSTKINPATGRDWFADRNEIQKKVMKNTIDTLVNKKSIERQRLIERDWKRLDCLNNKLQKFIESEDFIVNQENLKYMLEAYEKIKMNYAKLQEFIRESSKGNNFKFNINVPLKYITAEGRKWLAKTVENPIENMIEGDYEILDNEQDLQAKNRIEQYADND